MSQLTTLQTADVLKYMSKSDCPGLSEASQLDEFAYFVEARAGFVEWSRRHQELQQLHWSKLSTADRLMLIDQQNEEARDKHRVEVMKKVEEVTAAHETLYYLIKKNENYEDSKRVLAEINNAVRTHKGMLASLQGRVPYSPELTEKILSYPYTGESE